ncbi:hypothetical protein ACFVFF_23195 [Streptomyces sp. NPDC057680]|uniref:hypothetical protein n=1 Tax=Streptomyces sp. NPDC057680 TaxID=3346208 RepID=UPI00367AC8A1
MPKPQPGDRVDTPHGPGTVADKPVPDGVTVVDLDATAERPVDRAYYFTDEVQQ